MSRTPLVALSLLLMAHTPAFAALIGGPKTIPLDASGNVPGVVVSTQMGMGGYVKGATKIAVPLVMVAFESNAKAKTVRSSGGTTTTKSLENHLMIDEKYLQAIADQVQAIVEQDLKAQGFTVLPNTEVDKEARYAGITKDGKSGVEVGDNFMSGFGGNGVKNRWYTAGNRPFFGTGAQGPLSETSALIHLARESGKTLLFYRFKIQFTEIDAKNNLFFSSVKGKNVLHMVSADATIYTPANTLGSMIKLDANLTAGSDFISDVQELPKNAADEVALNMGAALEALRTMSAVTTTSSKASGHYGIVADPAKYSEGSLALIKATSRQFAEAIRKAQK